MLSERPERPRSYERTRRAGKATGAEALEDSVKADAATGGMIAALPAVRRASLRLESQVTSVRPDANGMVTCVQRPQGCVHYGMSRAAHGHSYIG